LFTWHADAVAWCDWYTPLEARRDQALAAAEDAGGGANVVGGDAADLRDALRRILRDRLLELAEADGVRVHERTVDPAVPDQLVLDPVQQRQVRAVADRQVDVGLLRHPRSAWVDDD